MVAVLHSLLAVVHVLAGAAWLGAMTYSLFILHPRAHVFFTRDTDLEAFLATVSHGARWKVLGGLGLLAVTGTGLAFLCWPKPLALSWLVLLSAKVVLFLVALALFVHVSWRLWPARVCATPDEIPRFQRLFRRVGVSMILIAGLSMALGVVAHTW